MADVQAGMLEGVKVVDLTRLLPGPFATMLLADMGAEVIKVEEPGLGDYARFYPPMVGTKSAFFQSVNRNKRFVTLNLKTNEGCELLLRLLEEADVLIESFRPGVMDRMGPGIDKLQEMFPGLVIASLTGFGQDGSSKAGHDANFLAFAGVLGLNGTPAAPQLPGVQIADLAGGALYAALGISAALYRKARTGQGGHLDISITEGALSLLIPTVAMQKAGVDEQRGAGMLTGGLPRYSLYETADGRYLMVAALEPKFWDPFVEALGLVALRGRGMTNDADGQDVRARLQATIAERSLKEWEEFLAGLDVCVAPVWSLEEIMDAELHRIREVFFTLQGVAQVRTPVTAKAMRHRPAQDAGADNESVFGALGVSREELVDLKKKGVL